ncbi:hypothetical protein Q5P01_022946 [Channa striata]|uniref:Ig-like domain-containing protein n=1 Tax=Channa striata TaxID=64152 RepID=A0AA88LRY9_CHASR|nr:hypothetical protein Q5P01_022946 [Channa striata]
MCSMSLVVIAAQLVQDDLTLTRRLGQTVSFSCAGTDQCSGSVVYWYQKKETETFRVILYINRYDGGIGRYYNHPQENDFSPVKGKGWELQIEKVKQDHSASYYCSCRISGSHSFCIALFHRGPYYDFHYYHEIFGSGTKLHVTDEQVVKPVVSVYPAASRDQQGGRTSLLCVASDMVPPQVQFSWKRRKENDPVEMLTHAEGEQLVLRESGRTISILVVDQDAFYTYNYRCQVQHEGGAVEARTEQVVPVDPVQSRYQVKLLCLLYTALIVKSLVYCCGLSLLRSLRDQGLLTDSRSAFLKISFQKV